VFVLQGTLALFISAPLQVAASAAWPDPIGPLQWAGLGVFALGFGCEAIADAQLQAFRRDPLNKGQVMDRGLWQ
jgi:steroid 5-alpha reductase family enzyme